MEHIDKNQLCKEINEEMIAGLVWEPTQPVVAMFGSARLKPDTQAYKDAQELSARLAKGDPAQPALTKFIILTGGGPGIMEAGNKGAFDIGETSVGLNIVLPHEQKGNDYQNVSMRFHHFTARKAVFVRRTDIFIAFEGGFGTLDEIFDTVTQIQTGKRPYTQIILMGSEFWTPMINWINSTLLSKGVINQKETTLFKLVDSVDEAEAAVREMWAIQRPHQENYKEVESVKE
jgi:uncharacterized protein (TIGR00730 family)